jgi:hypothetical protein
MRTSIWFRTEEKNPDKSGYYLSYRGWGMGGKGDYDHDYGYLYYRKKDDSWYEHEGSWNSSFPDVVSFVYYWTDATPDDWTDQDPPSVKLYKLKELPHSATLDDAWKKVQEAINQYNMLKELVR